MKESREDYTRVMRGRYARRTGKAAHPILLNQFCQSKGLGREHAKKVLRGQEPIPTLEQSRSAEAQTRSAKA